MTLAARRIMCNGQCSAVRNNGLSVIMDSDAKDFGKLVVGELGNTLSPRARMCGITADFEPT
jgi:hypothetical protein